MSPSLGWGFTHTQFSADHGSTAAVRGVRTALSAQPLVQNQHIMGWGASNPEPEPGVYDFRSLDSRIEFIRASGGIPVITLCCAPDWMKGGSPGTTDWDRLTEAPLAQHFDDFAALSATVARRYPDVRHYLVWNEFKGFFDADRNRWDAEAYTELYNEVHRALKDVDPDIQVGGPYLDMAAPPRGVATGPSDVRGRWGFVDPRTLSAFRYWLRHKDGADFVVVDGHAPGPEDVPDEFAALAKFGAVNSWIREQTDLPLWWAEWYVPTDPEWSAERAVALRVAAMIELASSGADTVLYWNPQPAGAGCATCLWTDTAGFGGGRPLPFLTDVLQRFASTFPPSQPVEEVEAGPSVRVLAQPRAWVAVNTTDAPVTATIGGSDVELAPYEVAWSTRRD